MPLLVCKSIRHTFLNNSPNHPFKTGRRLEDPMRSLRLRKTCGGYFQQQREMAGNKEQELEADFAQGKHKELDSFMHYQPDNTTFEKS